MQRYVGTKTINATPMTRLAYNELRAWKLPDNEALLGDAPGYLVEYTDGGAPNVAGFAGYISWSPKDVFERTYRPVVASGRTFGWAIEWLKQGGKVAREGWNGKGMWLSYSPGHQALEAEKFWSGPNREFAEQAGGSVEVLPCLTMKTADGKILMGWLASQSDMLADDWTVVP